MPNPTDFPKLVRSQDFEDELLGIEQPLRDKVERAIVEFMENPLEKNHGKYPEGAYIACLTVPPKIVVIYNMCMEGGPGSARLKVTLENIVDERSGDEEE